MSNFFLRNIIKIQKNIKILEPYRSSIDISMGKRDRVGLLGKLDVQGIRLREAWTPAHTTAMRDALEAIANGEWMLVFDPAEPVWITTDASGNNGFCITAHQVDTVHEASTVPSHSGMAGHAAGGLDPPGGGAVRGSPCASLRPHTSRLRTSSFRATTATWQ
jgi:hypothetical protein